MEGSFVVTYSRYPGCAADLSDIQLQLSNVKLYHHTRNNFEATKPPKFRPFARDLSVPTFTDPESRRQASIGPLVARRVAQLALRLRASNWHLGAYLYLVSR